MSADDFLALCRERGFAARVAMPYVPESGACVIVHCGRNGKSWSDIRDCDALKWLRGQHRCGGHRFFAFDLDDLAQQLDAWQVQDALARLGGAGNGPETFGELPVGADAVKRL